MNRRSATSPDRLVKNQVTALPIHHGHALRAAVLPEHHRDPFDRMLVAQAQLEGLQLMTEDKLVARYDVEILSGRGSGAIPPPPEPDAEDADTEGTS
ncbi:MAG: type II toxin-antitoxin system VapC family toxin [bacterium]|nr:type II toxin-antitoxin system VapC family toxin [bacterium]